MTNTSGTKSSQGPTSTSLTVKQWNTLVSAHSYLALVFGGVGYSAFRITAGFYTLDVMLALLLSYLCLLAARMAFLVYKDKRALVFTVAGLATDLAIPCVFLFVSLPWATRLGTLCLLTSLALCLATAARVCLALGKASLRTRAHGILVGWTCSATTILSLRAYDPEFGRSQDTTEMFCLGLFVALTLFAVHLSLSVRQECKRLIDIERPGWHFKHTAHVVNSTGNAFFVGVPLGGVGGAIVGFPIWTIIGLVEGYGFGEALQIGLSGLMFLGLVGLIFGGPIAAAYTASKLRREALSDH